MNIGEHIYNQFKKGNLDAFYAEIYPSLLSMAMKMLPAANSFLAEDLVQESILSAYRNRANISSPASLKSYLFTCVHNGSVTMIRKDIRKQKYEETFKHFPVGISIDGKIMMQETLDLLYDTIKELPEEYRQIFDMSYVQGLSNAEIAKILNLSLSGAKKRKARFIELMREKLGDADDMCSLIE